MKHPSVFFALLAGVAIGCAPTTPNDTGTAEKKDDTTLAQNAAPETDPVAIKQPDTGPGMVGTEPAKPVEKKPTTESGGPAAAAPQTGGQQGGRQGGGRRGGNLFSMLGNEQLRTQIKAELKLTDDQIKEIQAVLPQQGQGGGAQQLTPEERQKQREELQKKIEAILTPAQTKRVKEIQLQMQGTRALSQPEVVKELGLSTDQVTKIEAALQAGRPQGGAQGGPQGGAQGGATQPATPPTPEERQKMMAAFTKAREEANKKALAVLTPSQKKKWDAMLGKKFELKMPEGGGASGAGMGTPR